MIPVGFSDGTVIKTHVPEFPKEDEIKKVALSILMELRDINKNVRKSHI